MLPSWGRAHAADSYTSAIYKDLDGWNLRLNFSSTGILEALRHANKDFKLQLENTSDFKEKLNTYLVDHVAITVNQESKIELDQFAASVNSHATDVFYILKNIPDKPVHWRIRINACETNTAKPINTLLVQDGSKSTSQQLKASNNYSATLIKMGKDGYKWIQ